MATFIYIRTTSATKRERFHNTVFFVFCLFLFYSSDGKYRKLSLAWVGSQKDPVKVEQSTQLKYDK